jgi:signal transduction histidine kinase/CheY-like chemotaxis protein
MSDKHITSYEDAEEALRQRDRQLELLALVSHRLLLDGDSERELPDTIFEDIARLIGMERFYHYRPSDEPTILRLHTSGGVPEQEREWFATTGFGERFCGWVAERRERLLIEDLQHSSHPGSDVHKASAATSYVGFPLVANGELVGTIAFVSTRRTHLREGDVQMLQTICDQIAAALGRMKLQHELREFAAQLEGLVAERTKELLQSQHRLRALATELNLAEQRERKRLATELHDYLAQLLAVGKMYLDQIKQETGAPLVKELDETLEEALTYTRTLVAQLSPPFFHEFGLSYAFKWLAEQLESRGLRVTVEVEDGRPSVTDDHATLLFQAARELLMNVVKHAESTHARIAMTTTDRTLQVKVSDDGRGFDVAAMDALAVTGTQGRFGLFSIRERMIAMGGRFELVSRPGEGTQATLVVPLNGSVAARVQDGGLRTHLSGPDSAHGPHDSHLREGLPIRVLLVDDHAIVRQGLRSILDAYADVEVVGEAAAGDEAVGMVDHLRPSVVVMDINMPRMNGIEATAAIKARHSSVVVIGLSVQADEFARYEMLRAGATALMTKEAAVDELYRAIQEALHRKVKSGE